MPDTKPLFHEKAVAKIQDMLGNDNIVMFCCNLDAQPFAATPMSTQKVEDDGTIWFFSTRDSERNRHLSRSPRAQVLFGDSGQYDYISLYGRAEVIVDAARAEELWTPFVKVWFPEGPSDPDLTLIRFRPEEGFYWDTQHNKMIAFAKMVASTLVGKTMDDSVEGRLEL